MHGRHGLTGSSANVHAKEQLNGVKEFATIQNHLELESYALMMKVKCAFKSPLRTSPAKQKWKEVSSLDLLC